MNPKAIPQIDCHMNQQPQTDQSELGKSSHHAIQKNGYG